MGRKTTTAWLRAGVLAASWFAAAWHVQHAAGSEMGDSVQRLEQRLRGKAQEAPVVRPRERPRDEPIRPWELVDV